MKHIPIEAGQASLPELARAVTAFHSVTYAAYGAHARDDSRVSQLLCINSHLVLPTPPFFFKVSVTFVTVPPLIAMCRSVAQAQTYSHME